MKLFSFSTLRLLSIFVQSSLFLLTSYTFAEPMPSNSPSPTPTGSASPSPTPTSAASPTPTPTGSQNYCHLCFYDPTDPELEKACKAVRTAMNDFNPRVNEIINAEEASERINALGPQLCKCDEIGVKIIDHAAPRDYTRPFELAGDLMTNAPSCEEISIDDLGCSVFAYSNYALQQAQLLAQEAASMGFEGNVSVSGNQVINTTFSLEANIMYELVREKGNLLVRLISRVNKQKIMELVDQGKRQCACQVSPITFSVCAGKATVGLSPCKEPGTATAVATEDNNGSPVIACAKEEKRMNQICERDDSDEAFEQFASQAGDDEGWIIETSNQISTGDVAICIWQEPKPCGQ